MAIAVASEVCRYCCLGSVVLYDASGEPRAIRTRKQAALLLFLARRMGRPIGRDELIELLWSSHPEKAAKHSLSQTVSLINKSLGCEAVVTSGRERLVLREGVVTLDANEFERLATAGEHDATMKLWRGTLFDGLYVQRAPDFERWLSEERVRLQRVFRRLMHVRLQVLRSAGDYTSMRDESDRLLQYDSLDERAMLINLEALSLLDDRTLALRRYTEFEGHLRDELGAEPSVELKAWAKRNRSGERNVTSQRPSRVGENTVLPNPIPLFGRTTESGTLWKAWEEAQRSRGSFQIVQGDAGIGKSALLGKVVTQVHVGGGSVAFVRCYRTERSVPFAPTTALIRQLSRLQGFIGLDPVWLGELTRLVPELRDRFPHAPLPLTVDDAVRHRVCDASVQAALAVAEEQPLLIAIDDLQEADEATLALFHYLARQLDNWPILLLATKRNGQASSESEKHFFESAAALAFGSFLSLEPLKQSNTEEIVQRVLARRGIEPEEALVSRLAIEAGGIPLRAIEGALAVDTKQRAQQTSSHGARSFFENAKSRLARLSSEAQETAVALAIAGRPLSEFDLAELTSFGATRLASAIMLLEDAQLLHRTGAELCFTHETYSSLVERTVEAASKKSLHLRIARLFGRADRSSPANMCEIARHLSAAGRRGEAAAYAQSAAEHAETIGAIRSSSDALELVMENESPAKSVTITRLAWCYLQLGESERLRDLISSQGADSMSSSPRDDLRFYGIASRFDSAETELDVLQLELQRLTTENAGFSRWADAHCLLIRIADKTGEFSVVHQSVKALRQAARIAGRDTSQALFATGYSIAKYYWPRRAIPVFQEAVAQAEAERNWPLALVARDCLAIVLKQVGRYRESIDAFNYSIALARKTMNHSAEMRCLINVAVSEMALGDYSRATETLAAAERFASDFITQGYCVYNRAMIALISRRPRDAFVQLQQLSASASRVNARTMESDAGHAAAMALQRVGDKEAFCEHMAKIEAACRADEFVRIGWAPAAAQAWQIAWRQGDYEHAIARLRVYAKSMARRDVALWLALEYELILLTEARSGVRDNAARRMLVTKAQHHDAGGVIADAQN